ncbi:MAG TPA: FUSC family protein [Gaiellaceae bacterium]|nr:FUSC family protein [Gaiellaceae bacterium]
MPLLRRLVAGRDLVTELRLAIKMTIGGTGAWWVASGLGATRPLFAALVPLVAMSGDPFAAVSVSFARILGVFAGVGIGLALLHIDVSSTWLVALALVVATLVGIVLKIGERPNFQVAIAALFVIGFAGQGASQIGVQRIWETAIGAVVAIGVSVLVWPPDPIRELERRLERLRQQLAADFAVIADDLATGSGATSAQLDDLREHSLDAVRDLFELDPARRALRWNPLRRNDVGLIDELGRRINLAVSSSRHARSLGRDVADTRVRSPELAAAMRHLADAVDRGLLGQDRLEALNRAEHALSAPPVDHDRAMVSSQLRQLLTDLRPG